ncbi:MAG: hypothetical protein ACLFUI_08880 [Halanaerobiales bacterium]
MKLLKITSLILATICFISPAMDDIVYARVRTGVFDVSDYEISLLNEYTYYYPDRELPQVVRKEIEPIKKTTLFFNISGFIDNWQYHLDSNFEFDEDNNEYEGYNFNLDRFTMSSLLGKGIVEIGKKKWVWGEGFISNPTNPLSVGEEYWGLDYSRVMGVNDLNVGAVYTDGGLADIDIESSGNADFLVWLRWGGLLESSNYTLTATFDDQRRVNLGIDFSTDLTMDITTYTAYNHSISDSGGENSYLLGIEYFMEKMLFILEYSSDKQDMVLLSINSSDIFSDYSWSVKEIINLDDDSRRESVSFSYQNNDYATPTLECFRHTGEKGSYYSGSPWDWGIGLSVRIEL